MADALQTLKRALPASVKRRLKQAVPRRLYGRIDPDWHRGTIGNPRYWEALGQLQFDFLLRHGLQPSHYLLDVGCGPLRGGVRFIGYLEPGHYYGVEKEADVLEEAERVELPRHGLVDRRPVLRAMADFDFPSLGRQFEYALAQSVFTHLTLNSIIRCLMQMEQALAPGGTFYATFWDNPGGKSNLDPIRQHKDKTTYFDRDAFHYDVATFEWVCEGTSLTVQNLGEWGHPQRQQMLAFTRQPAEDAPS